MSRYIEVFKSEHSEAMRAKERTLSSGGGRRGGGGLDPETVLDLVEVQ